MYGMGIERGSLIREEAGPITAGITVRAGQGRRKAGTTAWGRGRRARVEGGKTRGPVLGYV